MSFQPPESGGGESPILIRRNYYPEGRFSELKLQGTYFPCELEEFNRLLKQIRSASTAGTRGFVRAANARYSARLTSDGLLTGEALFEFPDAAEPACYARLSPWSMRIDSAAWDGDAGRSALLGSDGEGLLARLETPGVLRVGWSQWAVDDARGDPTFLFDLPQVDSSDLFLELPGRLELETAGGIVQSVEPAADGHSAWHVRLGRRSRLELHLRPMESAPSPPSAVYVSQTSAYELSLKGLTLSAEFRLSSAAARLPRRVTLQLEPGVDLVRATLSGTDIPWTISPQPPGGPVLAVLDLGEGSLSSEGVIQVLAVGRLVSGAPWPLPRASVPELTWEQGSTLLRVRSPLGLADLKLNQAGPTRVGSLPAPTSGEIVELACFSPDAAVQIEVRRRSVQWRVAHASSVLVAKNRIECQTVAEFSPLEGEARLLTAEVSPQWEIDQVESAPAGQIADWEVETDSTGRQTLTARLERSLKSGEKAILLVQGRRAADSAAVDSVGGLAMLQFPQASLPEGWVSAETADGLVVRFPNSGEVALSQREKLTLAEASLFPKEPRGTLFRLSPDVMGASLMIEQRPEDSPPLLGESDPRDDPADPPPVSPTGGAVAWIESIDSWLEGGTVRHRSRFGIECGGATALEFAVPQGIAVTRTWVDEDEVRPTSDNLLLRVQVPQGARFVLATIDWETVAESENGLLIVRADGPAWLGGTSFDRAWRLWTPPSLVVLDAFGGSGVSGSAPAGIWQRLFGPLGRASGTSLFHPLDEPLAAWEGFRTRAAAKDSSQQDISAVLESFGRSCDRGGSTEATWNSVLLAATKSAALREKALLVDSATLGELGIEPADTVGPLQDGPRDDLVDAGRGVLDEHALDLWVGSTVIVLTGASRQADADRRADWERAPVHLAGNGAGAEFDPQRMAAGLLTVEEWGQPTFRPWQAGPPAPVRTGWTRFHGRFGGSVQLRAFVVRRAWIDIVRWGTCLVVAAALATMGPRWPRATLTLSACIVAAAMLIPERYVPYISPASLGAWGGLILAFLRRTGRARSGMIKVGVPVAAAVLIGAAFIVPGPPPLAAQLPDDRPIPPSVYDVFLPVDDQGRPTGTRLFVPAELYELMLRRTTASGDPVEARTLITQTVLRAWLGWDGPAFPLRVDRLTVELEFHAAQSDNRVPIPVAGVASRVIPESIRVDGAPVGPSMGIDGEFITVEAGAGRHTLLFDVEPPSTATPGGSAIIPLPGLPRTRVELTIPENIPGLSVIEPDVSLLADSERGRLWADVGPAQQMKVAVVGAGAGGPPVPESVEEWIWLRIQPGTVVVEGKFQFEVGNTPTTELTIRTDSRLRLLPSDPRDPLISQVKPSPAPTPGVVATLSRPVTGAITLNLRFLWVDATGLGQFRLPEVTAQAGQRRRWIGVSVHPNLAFSAAGTEGLHPVDGNQFANMWGLPPDVPQLAYEQVGPARQWLLEAYQLAPRRSVVQRVSLGVRTGAVHVRLDADLATTGGPAFLHRLSVPPELEIDQLSVLEEGAERVAHFERIGPDGVNVFLTSPAQGTQRIRLRGRLPLEGEEMPLPILGVAADEVAASEVAVYRQPAVLVEVEPAGGLERQPDRAGVESDPILGRMVGRWRVAAGASARLRVLPNQPRTKATQITTLEYHAADDAWYVQADVWIAAEGGVVDTLRWTLPPQWIGPHTVVSESPAELLLLAEQEQRFLVVKPLSAIGTLAHLAIRGRWDATPGGLPAAPGLAPEGIGDLERWLRLPRRGPREGMVWNTEGLEERELPPGSVPRTSGSAGASFQTFHVTQGDFTALGAREGGQARAGYCPLLEADLTWNGDGRTTGLARFHLVLESEEPLTLRLPPGFEALSLEVDGAPLSILQHEDGRIEVPPGSGRERVIAVAYQGAWPAVADGSRSGPIPAPEIEGLEVHRALWTLIDPKEARVALLEGSPPISPAAASALKQDALRLAGIDPASPPAPSGAETCFWMHRGEGRPATFVSDRVSRPKCSFHRAAVQSWNRLGAALCALAVAGVIAWRSRQGAGSDLLRGLPQTIVVLAGLLLSAVVTPGWIGWVVAGSGALLVFKSKWRTVLEAAPRPPRNPVEVHRTPA
jgi:hypothetical protein